MRILHTSDWHLGNRLMGESRLEEFRAFLEWLLLVLQREKVEALLVSGDVFDSTTPGDKVRELYCDFLSRADATGCRSIIVTAGNHDSVQQLQVAAPLLKRYHACVVAHLSPDSVESCLVPLLSEDGKPVAMVAAVPFLRVHEVASVTAVDDEEARRLAYVRGIAACYERVAQAAKAWKAANPGLPVIAMGHLSVAGVALTSSTHPAFIGTVETVGREVFDPVFDYVALGHIHRYREMDGGRIRYCGSPLPMGFDEARTPGYVLLADVSAGGVRVSPIEVPAFVLYREDRCASREEVEALLAGFARRGDKGRPLGLQLTYTGADSSLSAIQSLVDEQAEACGLGVYKVMRGEAPLRRGREEAAALPTLSELSPEMVFERRLREWREACDTPPDEERVQLLKQMFTTALNEACATLSLGDSHEN